PFTGAFGDGLSQRYFLFFGKNDSLERKNASQWVERALQHAREFKTARDSFSQATTAVSGQETAYPLSEISTEIIEKLIPGASELRKSTTAFNEALMFELFMHLANEMDDSVKELI